MESVEEKISFQLSCGRALIHVVGFWKSVRLVHVLVVPNETVDVKLGVMSQGGGGFNKLSRTRGEHRA